MQGMDREGRMGIVKAQTAILGFHVPLSCLYACTCAHIGRGERCWNIPSVVSAPIVWMDHALSAGHSIK